MNKAAFTGPLEQVDACCYRIPKSYKPGMRVDGLIFANEKLIEHDPQGPGARAGRQRRLPARHPGRPAWPCRTSTGATASASAASAPPTRTRAASSRPAASATTSTAASGWCARTSSIDDVKPHLRELVEALFHTVPTGVGQVGQVQVRRQGDCAGCMGEGPRFVVDRGLGVPRDLDHTEADGRLDGADPDQVSDHAVKRGAEQCGTLGSRQPLPRSAGRRSRLRRGRRRRRSGLEKDMVCVMIHSGSRGLGYQVCDDALATFRNAPGEVRHRAARPAARLRPVDSPEGQQVHRRDAGRGQLRLVQPPAAHAAGPRGLRAGLRPVVAGPADGPGLRRGPQHRQARRAHGRRQEEEGVGPPQGGDAGVPAGPPGGAGGITAQIGQPVIIPGDMGRASWVLVGQPGSMEQTFGTTCHGAGRAMSRTAAVKRRRRPPDRQGTGGTRRHRDGPEPQRPRGGAAEGVQERRRRGRGRPRGRTCRRRSRGCGRSA